GAGPGEDGSTQRSRSQHESRAQEGDIAAAAPRMPGLYSSVLSFPSAEMVGPWLSHQKPSSSATACFAASQMRFTNVSPLWHCGGATMRGGLFLFGGVPGAPWWGGWGGGGASWGGVRGAREGFST